MNCRYRRAPRNDLSPTTLDTLQDRAGELQREISSLGVARVELERGIVDRADVARALSQFDVVWEHLTSREQEKLLRLLIEKVAYDGGAGTVSITFRATGIRNLLDAKRRDVSTGEGDEAGGEHDAEWVGCQTGEDCGHMAHV